MYTIIRLLLIFCISGILVFGVSLAQDDSCILASRLVVGEMGEVTAGSANNVRTNPSTSAELVFRMEAGSRFEVLDGPLCAEGYQWWQVSYQNQIGWTVEGSEGEYFLMPIETASATATANPENTNSAPCSLAPRLVVGQIARVVSANPSRVRDTASLSGQQIGQADGLDMLTVLDGPVCTDGINWWLVRFGDTEGWTAEGLDGEYFLELVPLSPTPTPAFAALPNTRGIDWSADGQFIAVATDEGLYVFATDDFAAEPTIYFAGTRIEALAFNPQVAEELAVATVEAHDDGADMSIAQLVDVTTGEIIRTIFQEFLVSASVSEFRFSADATILAGHGTFSFEAYSVESGSRFYSVSSQIYDESVGDYQRFRISNFSPDAAWVAGVIGLDGSSYVFVGEFGASDEALIGIETVSIDEAITAMAFSPDSSRFVVGGSNGNLRMWSVPDFEYHSFIRGERSTTSNRVNDLAFSPTASILATAEGDPLAVVRIFDAETLEQEQAKTLPDSQGAAEDLVFSPDGSQIAVSVDDTVMILNSETLEVVARLVLRWN